MVLTTVAQIGHILPELLLGFTFHNRPVLQPLF